MNLEDAMERLRRARDSSPHSSQPSQSIGQLDDTFTSTEDSFEGDGDEGNKTVNLSRVIGRLSIGTNARMSIGYQDSNMEESEVYGTLRNLHLPNLYKPPMDQISPGKSLPFGKSSPPSSNLPRLLLRGLCNVTFIRLYKTNFPFQSQTGFESV
jgi:kinetochore protein Spc7/SPC105